MKFFKYMKDGGEKSTAWGYWLVEIKGLFSIVLLKFEDGSRDAYHSHAFNAFSWVLKGKLLEQYLDGHFRHILPSWMPFLTYRDTFHKVTSYGTTYALTFRGPWAKSWYEFIPETGDTLELVNGRKIVNTIKGEKWIYKRS